MTHIGTLRENPLHASLKEWYSRPGDLIEHSVGAYVIDLVRDGLLIEIQTGSFSKIKTKLTKLLESGHAVRVVFPVLVDKWIVKVNADGEVLERRKSPKHGATEDVFSELVNIVGLLANPHLQIEVISVTADELRVHCPGKAWRRKGWVVAERRLVEVCGFVVLDDLCDLLPDDLSVRFTTSDLAEALGRPVRLAQQMAYCLRKTGAIKNVGKTGNSIVYEVAHCS